MNLIPATERCVCRHLTALHAFGVRGGIPVRTYCSAAGCGCRQMTVDETAPARHCQTCGQPIPAGKDTA